MGIASTLDPSGVALGRAVGYILILGVLPVAVIIFIVSGWMLISRHTLKLTIVFIVSGLVTFVLCLPFLFVVQKNLRPRIVEPTVQPTGISITEATDSITPSSNAKPVQIQPANDSWEEFTGITISKTKSPVSASDLYKRISPAVVTVITKKDEIESLENAKAIQGTGVVLRSRKFTESVSPDTGYWLLTCYHNVRGMKAQFILINNKGDAIETTAEAAVFDDENDWCLLPLRFKSLPNFDNLPALATAETLPEIGEDMFTIGTPEGMDLTLSKGIVSSLRSLDHGEWIQTTCPVSSGSSGSPAFDSNGNFLGIAVQSLKEGQNINFVVSAFTMRKRFNSNNLLGISFPKH